MIHLANIVFDIGNVICEWNPQKLVSSVFSYPEECKCALENIIGHKDWLMLDRGTLCLEEAIPRAARRCQLSEEKISKLFEETPKSLIPFPETVDVIKELGAKGFNLYVLSNMHDYAFEYLSSTYNFWHYFSGIVVSSHVNSIKPEPEIFNHLIDTYDLIPPKTLFLDDMSVNVQAAKKHGLEAMLIENISQLKTELNKRIGI